MKVHFRRTLACLFAVMMLSFATPSAMAQTPDGAVPAVLAYNYLISRNKGVMDDIRGFGSDLHSVLLGSAAKG